MGTVRIEAGLGITGEKRGAAATSWTADELAARMRAAYDVAIRGIDHERASWPGDLLDLMARLIADGGRDTQRPLGWLNSAPGDFFGVPEGFSKVGDEEMGTFTASASLDASPTVPAAEPPIALTAAVVLRRSKADRWKTEDGRRVLEVSFPLADMERSKREGRWKDWMEEWAWGAFLEWIRSGDLFGRDSYAAWVPPANFVAELAMEWWRGGQKPPEGATHQTVAILCGSGEPLLGPDLIGWDFDESPAEAKRREDARVWVQVQVADLEREVNLGDTRGLFVHSESARRLGGNQAALAQLSSDCHDHLRKLWVAGIYGKFSWPHCGYKTVTILREEDGSILLRWEGKADDCKGDAQATLFERIGPEGESHEERVARLLKFADRSTLFWSPMVLSVKEPLPAEEVARIRAEFENCAVKPVFLAPGVELAAAAPDDAPAMDDLQKRQVPLELRLIDLDVALAKNKHEHANSRKDRWAAGDADGVKKSELTEAVTQSKLELEMAELRAKMRRLELTGKED